MKKIFIVAVIVPILVLIGVLASISSDEEKAEPGAKEQAEEVAPKLNLTSMQAAVDSLKIAARSPQLDTSYDEVDTVEDFQNVTAGNGAFNLYDYLLLGSFPIFPPIDIAQDGKVTVD